MFFAELCAMKTAIEAPVPGIAPMTVPIPRLLKMIFHIEAIFLNGGKMSLTSIGCTGCGGSKRLRNS